MNEREVEQMIGVQQGRRLRERAEDLAGTNDGRASPVREVLEARVAASNGAGSEPGSLVC